MSKAAPGKVPVPSLLIVVVPMPPPPGMNVPVGPMLKDMRVALPHSEILECAIDKKNIATTDRTNRAGIDQFAAHCNLRRSGGT